MSRRTTSRRHPKKRSTADSRIVRTVRLLAAAFLLLVVLPPYVRAGDGYNHASILEMEATGVPRVRPGMRFPDVTVFDLDGDPLKLSSLWKRRPLVVETASASCPLALDTAPTMDTLVDAYGDRAQFVILYSREAHPGWFRGPHANLDHKRARAAEFASHVTRPVVVDDFDGDLHRPLGGGPNSVFVVGQDGIVAHASYWNEPLHTAHAMDAVLAHGGRARGLEGTDHPCEVPRHLSPFDMARYVMNVARTSGPDAAFDYLIHGIGPFGGPTECADG